MPAGRNAEEEKMRKMKTRKVTIVKSMLKNPQLYKFQAVIGGKIHNLCGNCKSLYPATKGEVLCPNCHRSIFDDLAKIGPVEDLVDDHQYFYGEDDCCC